MNAIVQYLLGMSRTKKRLLLLAADSVALICVFVAAMFLRLDSSAFQSHPKVWLALLPVVPLSLFVFVKLGLYRAVIRYIEGHALVAILLGAVASGGALAVVAAVLELPVPRSVPVIYTLLTFLVLGGMRFAFRELVLVGKQRKTTRVAIYGAGESGRQLVQMLRESVLFRPVVFLDDSLAAQGTHVAGLRVLAPEQIDRLIRQADVSAVLLAMPSASKARRSEILKRLERFPLQLLTVPGMDDIMAGRAKLDDVNDVKIEDLLGRDAVAPRPDLLGANITGKTVMVTGAGGSIGSELCRQILSQHPARLVLFELSEFALYSIEQELLGLRAEGNACEIIAILGSVQSAERVATTLRLFGVQTVYHAAAFKHVPLVEHNVAEGVRNNVFGTAVVLDAAVAARVESFIMVSTDKAVRPTNIMGASKRLAEMVCQAKAQGPTVPTKISMVRFGNVLGSSGSVIPLFQKQIAAGGPLTVTHPQITRFFMTIPEAAQLVIQAGAMGRGGDVFVLDMGDPVQISDLAAQMARLHGLKPVIVAKDREAKLGKGEIAIQFTGLRPGEKLYEELLIGDCPAPTQHPRIMSATEICLTGSALAPLLERLDMACAQNDIASVRQVMAEAQTGYNPNSLIADNLWKERPARPVPANVPQAGAKRLTGTHA